MQHTLTGLQEAGVQGGEADPDIPGHKEALLQHSLGKAPRAKTKLILCVDKDCPASPLVPAALLAGTSSQPLLALVSGPSGAPE